jgi:glycosyltransferase involved in cell wall biosynthesis
MQFLNVLITVDTEVWPRIPDLRRNGLKDDLDRDIEGWIVRVLHRISYQMDVLDAYRLRGVFLVESLFSCFTGPGPLRDIVGLIQNRGHEVQLHVHPEWLDWMPEPLLGERRGGNLAEFSEHEQYVIIGQALANLKEAGARDVSAFRAGNYGAGHAILRTLTRLGIHYDTSYSYCYLDRGCGLHLPEPLLQAAEINGVCEVPISFSDFSGHHRHAQLCTCSHREMRRALMQAHEMGWQKFVIVSHGFELLRRGARETVADPVVVRRFDELCRFLAENTDKFRTVGFNDLAVEDATAVESGIPASPAPHRTIKDRRASYAPHAPIKQLERKETMPLETTPTIASPALGAPRLRVAAVMDTWIVSGPGRQISALSQVLQAQGVELRIFMFQRSGRPTSPFIAYLERAGVPHVVIPDNGPLDTALPGRLRRAFDEWKPDIVQSHGYRMTTLVYLMRLAGVRIPWVAFFHGATDENWKIRLYNLIDRTLLRRADRLVVLSEENRSAFADVAERLRLIHNASFPIPPDGEPVRLGHLRQAGQPLIAAVSRLSPEKGLDLLIEAVARLSTAGRPVSLVVAGDGQERTALERQAATLGIQDRVHFLGLVQNVTSLYSEVDMVVLPSRPGREGLPNVLLEAMRADVPVVATAAGSVPEVLAVPGSGELVRPGNVDALVQGIEAALKRGRSPEAAAARVKAIDRFSVERRVAAHLALYAEMRPDLLAQSPLEAAFAATS